MTLDSNGTAFPEALAVMPTKLTELRPNARQDRWPTALPQAHPTGTTVGGLDVTPGRVYRALRRRWISALLLATAGAAGAGYLANRLVGETYVARTQVYFPPANNDVRGDNFQRRQSALVKSRQILHAALKDPSVSERYASTDDDDMVGTLEKNILADFKASPDVMQIIMKGSSPHELLALLNAVREAYLREGANKEVTDKTAALTWLGKLIAEDQVKLAFARGEIAKLAEEQNCPDVATLRLRDDSNRSRRNSLQSLRFQQEIQRNGLLQTRKELVANPPGAVAEPEVRPADLKAAIDLALTKDKVLETLKASIPLLEAQIERINMVKAEGTNPPGLGEKKKALDEAKAAVGARELTIRETVGREMRENLKREPNSGSKDYDARLRELKSQADELEIKNLMLDKEIEALDKTILTEFKVISELDRKTGPMKEVEDSIKANRARQELLNREVELGNPSRAQTDEVAVITQLPNPAKKMGMIIAAVAVGFLSGLFGVAFLELRAGRIDSTLGVERRLQAGVVGCIPRASPPVIASVTRPDHFTAGVGQEALCDAVDACRALILTGLHEFRSKVVMVTSAVEGEGKTTLSSLLALSLARAGYRTLLIDADLRRPGIHTLFGRSLKPGLSDVLKKSLPIDKVFRRSPLGTLGIVPAGECDSREAVSFLQLRLASILNKCKAIFEVIIIDSPPLDLPDGLVIGLQTDGAIISMMNEVSNLPATQSACARLRAINVPILGAVLNAAPAAKAGRYKPRRAV
jgi:polysaccharide biosynthesis transport protein